MSYYAYNPYVVNHQDREYFKRNDFITRFITYVSDQMSSFLSTSESKPQIIAYAAGAGLAAGVLIYVFGPTFFIDGNSMNGGVSAGGKRRQTVVGLYNPANDCFVNSVLQALAGCGELRKFLGGRMGVQGELEEVERGGGLVWKGRKPLLTKALKEMLDKLNERPLHRKTITTRDFIYQLERVFRSRISRNQQDAQEFLQIVAQTLAEEYEAQEKVRLTLKEAEEEAESKEEEEEEENEEDEKKERIEEGEEQKEKVAEGEEKAEKVEEGEEKAEKVDKETQETQEKQESGTTGDDTSEESFEVVPTPGEQSEEGKGTDLDISIIESVKSTTEEPESVAIEPSTPGTSNDEESASSTEEDEESPKPKPKHIALDTKIKELEQEKAEEDKKEKKEEPKVPEFGMPMEGKLESGIQCLVCGFEPKPTGSTFVVLTLNVPVRGSATLDDCFNEHLSTEFIDDFQCAKCKLVKMIAVQEKKLATTKNEKEASALQASLDTLNHCLKNDPEEIPKDTLLPPPKLTTVKSRIAKRTYFAHCPNVLAIHLSRSIFDYYSRKNGCKVAFPEELLLGPLLNRSKYKLLGLITHRGSHDSGHYECYRRQNSHPPPYSTPMMMMTPKGEVGTPVTPITPATLETPLAGQTPKPGASQVNLGEKNGESSSSGIDTPSASTPVLPLDEKKGATTTGAALPVGDKTVTATAAGKASKVDTLSLKSFPSKGKKSKGVDSRWWRISDDSVKEVKTNDVLGLQKEVYLLFYEKIHPER
ncbi:hypothetical protein TWF730_009880 [Orbilia blumenaviensis]|uniref:Ubiquitin carboxyl-terminal hydrolase n=1 Tax=Orbilia blumenaviensis TaxID=1796055 RepID=A0AAV9UUH3_9PEZI